MDHQRRESSAKSRRGCGIGGVNANGDWFAEELRTDQSPWLVDILNKNYAAACELAATIVGPMG